MLTVEQYDEIFEKERHHEYPIVDVYERLHEFAIDRAKLESMARVLACPLKANPPNWQHGRVLYTTLRFFLKDAKLDQNCLLLDIGTAKGFSACVMSHAVRDAKRDIDIWSIDVMSPHDVVRRNSVLEVGGLKPLSNYVDGFINRDVDVTFLGDGSLKWLQRLVDSKRRVPFAFVDGKHSYEVVSQEASFLCRLQKKGDVVMFDDCQIEPVGRAVKEAAGYTVRYVDIGPRNYAIAIRQ